MTASEPAWKPQLDRMPPHEGAFAQRPAVRGALRALNVAGGVVVAVIAFVVVGLSAALKTCEGEETSGLCVDHPGLVPVLEWPILVLAVLAPLAGGIASCVTRRARWLGLGILGAAVMLALMGLVSTGQTQYELLS